MKAINRHVRKARIFEGGKAYGVDWPTWNVCYPHLARAFCNAAEVVMGRKGLFMPIALSE